MARWAALACLILGSCNSNERQREELTDHYRKMMIYHSRMVPLIPEGSTIFIGDSQIQGLPVAMLGSPGINFGIGSDTSAGVLLRIGDYLPAIQKADAVVLAVGLNDFSRRSPEETIANLNAISRTIPPDVPVFFSQILPIRGEPDRTAFVNQVNAHLAQLPNVIRHAEIFDTDADGLLDEQFDSGDGIHLNAIGAELFMKNLRGHISGSPNTGINIDVMTCDASGQQPATFKLSGVY